MEPVPGGEKLTQEKSKTPDDALVSAVRAVMAERPSAGGSEGFSPTQLHENPAKVSFFPWELASLPQKEWLIDSFLGKSDIAVLTGERNVGKSFIAIWLAAKLVSGKALLDDRLAVPSRCRVAYACGEKWTGIRNRIMAALKSVGAEDTKDLLVLKVVPQLFASNLGYTRAAFSREVKRVMKGGVDLLIIDTMSTATIGMEENAAEQMNLMLFNVRQIQDELGCGVLLLHHPPKGAKTGTRGSGALEGTADTIVRVERSGADRTRIRLVCEKQGDADYFEPVNLQLKRDSDLNSLVIEPAVVGPIAAEESTAGFDEHQVVKLLRNRGEAIAMRDLVRELNLTSAAVRMAVKRYNNQSADGKIVRSSAPGSKRERLLKFEFNANANANY
jgi:hypothetical protein